MKKEPAALSRRLDALGATILGVPPKGAYARYVAAHFKEQIDSGNPATAPIHAPAQLVSKRRRAKTAAKAALGIRTGRQWRKLRKALKRQQRRAA